jgi:hypothetical protein
MLDQTLVVRAQLIKHLVKESCPIRGRGPCLILVYCGNEVVLWPLLVEPSPGTTISGIL